jgi:hypothetical protein
MQAGLGQRARPRPLLVASIKSHLQWMQGVWEKKRNGYHAVGSRETRMKKRGADLTSTRSISPATRCIRKMSPAASAGIVGKEAGMIIVQLEAVKRE